MLTDRMGIDIWEVLDAASTKPYGFMRFDPEPGMGGHCLPVDPLAEVLQADQLVVLESTTYPGTTRERVVPILEGSGLAAGCDLHVTFSPERTRAGPTSRCATPRRW